MFDPELTGDFSRILQAIRQHYGAGLIPLHAPCFAGQEKALVMDTIDSTFVSSVGGYVSQFEEEFAQFVGAPYAVAVVNGTMGLMLALRLAGVQKGDLVITQSLTFVATANAISMLGAEAVFVDVDSHSLGLCPAALREFLTMHTEQRNGLCVHKATQKVIRALMPMHTLGFVGDMSALVQVAADYHLSLVEDAAESLGSRWQGQHSGTFGRLGVFSFNGNKVITTGGGGMLVTQDPQLAKAAKHLSTTAKIPHAWKFEHDEIGYNLRMPNLNAALGVAQLAQLPGFLAEKKALAQKYQNIPLASPGLVILAGQEASDPNYWLNALLLQNAEQRDAFLQMSNDQQIQTRPLWTPLHLQSIYAQNLRGPLPVTENLAQRLVNIPSGVLCGK